MSVDIGAAGTIVAGGLAALQAVIAKTVGLLSAAMVFIWTPPGQAAALAAISAGIAEGAAVVAATKAQLLAPTATMVAHGAPVPISGAPAGALSPFAIAASALEAAAVPLKTATGVLGSALAAASSSNTGSAKTTPSVDNRDGRRDATPEPCCPADAHKVGAAGVGGAHTRGLGGAGQGGEPASAAWVTPATVRSPRDMRRAPPVSAEPNLPERWPRPRRRRVRPECSDPVARSHRWPGWGRWAVPTRSGG